MRERSSPTMRSSVAQRVRRVGAGPRRARRAIDRLPGQAGRGPAGHAGPSPAPAATATTDDADHAGDRPADLVDRRAGRPSGSVRFEPGAEQEAERLAEERAADRGAATAARSTRRRRWPPEPRPAARAAPRRRRRRRGPGPATTITRATNAAASRQAEPVARATARRRTVQGR